ncbi:TonB-dependent siderophore receptor [Pseudoxanthomonas sacheonensis]|uniref:Iron complex outermembrane receptor protein n=1 Tax=Pseudoxanthomonas sacheonensis TaxID=443615 RepID=A0ABU1RMU7_9GAMM|nr:TonB-dependent siderophore receptor [Pseudoxanthomonas sacheonensis]MDR6840097.1 iron complex outermembrane receptor protein [Pseudoxanthomonas sacheonensis]
MSPAPNPVVSRHSSFVPTVLRRTLLSQCLIVGLWAPTAVFAEDAAPQTGATTLQAVEVKGEVEGYVTERSGVMKTDAPLNETPQSITVISKEQIRDQNAQTMQEVLRYTAGVRSEMYGLDNRGDWFTLRGGSEGSVLLDGLRVPLTGWYGVVRNEPYAFERIEVLRGPASVIAGQNGPGGVVNLVSKRPQQTAQREISVQVGNDSHKQVAVDLTGPLNTDGTLLYRLVALGKDSGTQVDHADDKRTFIAPSLTWKPADGTTLTAYAEYQKDETGNTNGFFPIVGTLRSAPNGKIPYDTFISEPDWDYYGGTRKRIGYEFEQKLSDNWTLRHHLRHDDIDGKMRTMYAAWWEGFVDATGAADPDGTYLNRFWYFTDDTARINNADLLFEGDLTLGRTRHTLLVGVDAMNSRMRQVSWGDGLATPLDVYNPVYGTFPLPAYLDTPATDTYTRVRNVGLLVQDQIKFDDRWVLVAGLRHDRARTDTLVTYEGAQTPSHAEDSATSKNLGLVYLADGGWSPYLSYSESFEPVAGTDSSGNAFKPKRGKQAEAGVKWSPDDGRITAAAAIYQLKEKNRLSTDPADINESIQRGEVTVKGLELEVAANLTAWDLIASYTYMDARQTTVGEDAASLAYLDKQLSGIPKHSAAVWALHKFDGYGVAGLKAGAGVRYVGKTSDGIDVTTTPSSTLLDLMLSYETGPWRLALNVANATDKTYIATCLDRGDCWFGTKRKAIATIGYRW